MHILQIAIYTKPFKWQVWLLILATIPFIAMATFTSTKIDPSLTIAEKNRQFGLYKDSFSYSLGAFSSQGKISALLAIEFDIMAKQFSSSSRNCLFELINSLQCYELTRKCSPPVLILVSSLTYTVTLGLYISIFGI